LAWAKSCWDADMAVVLARSEVVRTIAGWSEMVDPECGTTYYHNPVRDWHHSNGGFALGWVGRGPCTWAVGGCVDVDRAEGVCGQKAAHLCCGHGQWTVSLG
jgi:hypothetical protein